MENCRMVSLLTFRCVVLCLVSVWAKYWKNIIFSIISAVHATAGRWPPQLTPCSLILNCPHPLIATNFLDVVSPSPFGSPSYLFSFSGCPFWCYLSPPGVAHSSYMSCPLPSPAPHSLYYIFHPSFYLKHKCVYLVILVYFDGTR